MHFFFSVLQDEEELDVHEPKKLKKLKAAVSDSSEEEEGAFVYTAYKCCLDLLSSVKSKEKTRASKLSGFSPFLSSHYVAECYD